METKILIEVYIRNEEYELRYRRNKLSKNRNGEYKLVEKCDVEVSETVNTYLSQKALQISAETSEYNCFRARSAVYASIACP